MANVPFDGCCGSCYWFIADDEDMSWGCCFEQPPIVVMDHDGDPIAAEPPVQPWRHRCGKYVRLTEAN